jgi:hypothetical protein
MAAGPLKKPVDKKRTNHDLSTAWSLSEKLFMNPRQSKIALTHKRQILLSDCDHWIKHLYPQMKAILIYYD